MSETTAWIILTGIAGAASLFWLITASWFVGVTRQSGESSEPGVKPQVFDELPRPSGAEGQVEVKGKPEELAETLASELGREGLNGLLVKVLDRDRSRVTFEVMATGVSTARVNGQHIPCGGKPRRCEVEFSPAGSGRSVAQYWIERGRGRGLLLVGWIFVALGLVAIVVLFGALATFVLPDPRSGVRAQVVQMVQCIHFLWPPWLFGSIYRQLDRAIRQNLSVKIANLPFV